MQNSWQNWNLEEKNNYLNTEQELRPGELAGGIKEGGGGRWPLPHTPGLSLSGFSKFTDLKRLVKYRWSNMMGIEGGDRRQRYVGRVGQAGTVSNHMTTRFSRISNVCLFSSHLTRQVKKSTSNWRRWHCPLNRLLRRGTWYHFARHRRSSLHPSHKGSKSLVGPTAANRLEVAYLYYKINKCSPKKEAIPLRLILIYIKYKKWSWLMGSHAFRASVIHVISAL